MIPSHIISGSRKQYKLSQENQPIRPPGLLLRLRSGQAPGVCWACLPRPRSGPGPVGRGWYWTALLTLF